MVSTSVSIDLGSSPDLKLQRLFLDLSVKLGIDLKESNKEEYIIARDTQEQKNVMIKVHEREKSSEPPLATIEGKELSPLLDIASSGRYIFSMAATEVGRIKEAISNALLKGESHVYVGSVEDSRVKDAAVFQLEQATKNVLIQEINGKPSYEPSNRDKYYFVENAIKEFQKCVFMTKDEYERVTYLGEEVSISLERPEIGRTKTPEISLER